MHLNLEVNNRKSVCYIMFKVKIGPFSLSYCPLTITIYGVPSARLVGCLQRLLE